jgi:sugar-specific transcriptional regulator TrmB
MAEAVALLEQLGFSEYEARTYVTLLQASPLTGYELARRSGIPRPNIYPVLQRLEERGAVMRMEMPEGVRYAPVPPAELLKRLSHRFDEVLAAARQALESLAPAPEPEPVWNLSGYAALLDHARALLEGASRALWIALWPPEAEALAMPMARAEERGVRITTLCLAACATACEGCRGQLYRYRIAPAAAARWLLLISDESEVVAGEIHGDGEAHGIRTRQRMLVDLIHDYIRHSIALAATVQGLGDQVRQLNPQARRWLAVVRRRLTRKGLP